MIDRDHIQNWGVNMRYNLYKLLLLTLSLKSERLLRLEIKMCFRQTFINVKEVSLPERKKTILKLALYMARFKKEIN